MSTAWERFNGGAVAVTATTALTVNSPRVVSCYNGSAIDVSMPDPAKIRSNQRGGPWFYVCRHSAGAVTVKDHAGATIHSLGAGGVAVIGLRSSGFYLVRAKTIGTARAAGHGSRPAVASRQSPLTFNPNCFRGSECELAEFEGNEPLDGEGGRLKCIVPMAQDVVAFAKNAAREVVRAADVVMPSVVIVTLDRDSLEPDPLHPNAGNTLPDEFWEAIHNSGKPHALKYVDPSLDAPGTTTRHPLHVRYWSTTSPAASGWSHGTGLVGTPMPVNRHRWTKKIQYETEDGVEREVEIAFVAEHCLLGAEAGADPESDPGSKMRRDYGVWGTVFSLFVFCDQVDPSWVDGSTYTPTGASGPVTFTRKDPIVSDLADGVGVGGANPERKRWFHPQMVCCAHLPTSYHAPFEGQYVPIDDRRTVGSRPQKNREFNYRRRAQSPFADPTTCTASQEAPQSPASDPYGVVAFGWFEGGVKSGAAYTFGGDFEPRSKPTEFLVWENGGATGATYLQPTKPGWDEACGTLDVEGGSSGSVKLCIDDEWGVPAADGSGRRVWNEYKYEECIGHPGEPMEDVGGGHKCFNNGNSTDASGIADCCITMSSSTFADESAVVIVASDRCKNTCIKYGPQQDASSCELLDGECTVRGSFTAQHGLAVEDYNYNASQAGNNATGRTISWAKFIAHPDAVYFNVVHSPAATDFNDEIGTMSRATLTVTGSGSGTSAPESAFVYEPAPISADAGPGAACSGVTCDLSNGDYTIKAEIDAAGKHVLGGRISVLSGNATCVAAEVVPGVGSNATLNIVKWIAGVRTVLKTLSISNYAYPNSWELKLWGSEHRLTCSALNVDLVAYDDETSFSSGPPFIGGPSGASFSSFEIVDGNAVRYMSALSGVLGKLTVGAEFPCEHHAIHMSRACQVTDTDPECGECCAPAKCDCKNCSDTAIIKTSALWDGNAGGGLPDRDIKPAACVGGSSPGSTDYGTDGDNPTWWGGPLPKCKCRGKWCPPNDWYCGDCPGPFKDLGLYIPFRCTSNLSDPANVPKMCLGIQNWYYVTLACF